MAKKTKRATTLRNVRLTGLPKGSTIKVSCATRAGKRCVGAPAIVQRNVSGAVRLKSWLARPLPVGTRVSITVKSGTSGASKTLTVKPGARPTVVAK